MNEILEKIKSNFNEKIKVEEKRPGIYQLYLPIYHEDGDMIDVFVVPKSNGGYELCDFGQTLMRLSYSYDTLPKKDRTRLTNTCDKQFTSLQDFKNDAKVFLQRERKE